MITASSMRHRWKHTLITDQSTDANYLLPSSLADESREQSNDFLMDRMFRRLPTHISRNGRLVLLLYLPSLWFLLILVHTMYHVHLLPSLQSLQMNRNLTQTTLSSLDVDNHCFPLKSWQETSFPTCNTLHELSFFIPANFLRDVALANHGYIRDIWKIPNYDVQRYAESQVNSQQSVIALKTLRWYNDFTQDNWRGQNFDALVSERLTASSFIANIYGYCGYSALYDYSPQGNLQDHLPLLGKRDQLRIAMEISSALADLHSIDDPKLASVVHADIAVRQFIKDSTRNSFLLTDFNTASPLYYRYRPHKQASRSRKLEQCPYYMKKALDKNRAPEEMMFSDDAGGNPVSEKIDVYSLGNIFYQFLTGQRIYQGMEVKDAQTLIVEGHAHSIVSSFLNTSDANESQELHINRILSHAIQMCLVREPAKRATAFEVANFLTNEWKIIDLDSSKR